MENLVLNTHQVLLTLSSSLALTLTLILGLRQWLPASHRRVQFSLPYFLTGMSLGLTLIISLVAWGHSDYKQYTVYEPPVDLDTRIIPQTIHEAKKMPPPPPAAKIEIKVPKRIAEIQPVEKAPEKEPTLPSSDPQEEPALRVATVSAPPPPPVVPIIEVDDKNEILDFVDRMPMFPGCDLDAEGDLSACSEEHLMTYLYKELRYPELAKEVGIEGVAVIQFVVEKDGSISDIQIRRDPGGGCGPEAVRVVSLMNELPEAWLPGKHRGKPVRVRFTLPVKFKLR